MEGTSSLLNSLPGISNSNETTIKRKVIPGDKLFTISEGYHAGSGCYDFHGTIVSSLVGYVHVNVLKNSQGDDMNIVEVRKKFDERSHLLPSQGKIVTARVELITQKFAKCSIICVEDTMLLNEFNSTLRKEDVREKERDKVELYKVVQPGDIILARVLGYGEAGTSYLLSIAEDQLGVVLGRGQNGQKLVPDSATLMKEKGTDYKEMRKVAQLPDLNK